MAEGTNQQNETAAEINHGDIRCPWGTKIRMVCPRPLKIINFSVELKNARENS